MDDREIIQDLQAPIISFRLFAIEKAIRYGNSSHLLDELQKRKTVEEDEECQLLLDHAILEVTHRFAGKPLDVSSFIEVATFPGTFQKADVRKKIALLETLRREQIEDLFTFGQTLLKTEKNPSVLRVLLKTFGNVWKKEQFPTFAEFLFSSSLSLRLSALEILSEKAPEMLLEYLPQFLVSEDPRIRILAIRGLAKIDMDEAVNHLEVLLFQKEPFHKQAALEISVFLPFDLKRKRPVLSKRFLISSSFIW